MWTERPLELASRLSFRPGCGWALLRPARLVATLLVPVFLAAPGSASQLRFDRITPADGLSQHSANAIAQDSQGYLWIGTQDGLNRYDGYDFVVHKTDPDDPDSLWDNFVANLWSDGDGGLWITTNTAGAINL